MSETNGGASRSFFLSEVAGAPVYLHGAKIGTLADLVVLDRDKVADVTHLSIARPYGRPPLVVPWDKVASFEPKRIALEVEGLEPYVVGLEPKQVLLKDHILDKKVLDVSGREVEVVYDVRLALGKGRLYVVEVDLSRYGLLRRVGLAWLARLIYSLADKIRSQTVPWSYVEPLPEKLGSFEGELKLKVLEGQLAELPPVDVADILEGMAPDQRLAVFQKLEDAHASDTLEELEPKVQRDLIASLEKGQSARLVAQMTPGQAADLLAALPWWDVQAILPHLDADKATKVKAILEKQESKVIDFASTSFLRFPPDATVGQVRAGYQQAARGKASTMYVYVLDETEKLLGVLDINELLEADEPGLLRDVMKTSVVSLRPGSTLRRASELFARYLFRALPVVDEAGKMLGVVPYKDVMTLRHRYLD